MAFQLEVSRQQIAEFNLGCQEKDAEHSYRVYVATFLGYGGNVARTRYNELLVSGGGSEQGRSDNTTSEEKLGSVPAVSSGAMF